MRRWKLRLGMSWFHMEYVFERGHASGAEGEAASIAGETKTQWQYRQGQVTFYMPIIATLDDEMLEKVFVHELMHVFVGPMSNQLERHDEEEVVATNLAQAFLWTYEQGMKDGKKAQKVG